MPEPRAPRKPIDMASEATRASINSQTRWISFRHPSYPPPAQPLLQLPAVDDGGVRFDMALCACGILAGNRFDGSYFTTTVRRGHDGDVVVVVDQPPPGDGLLRASTYDFHVSNPDGTAAGDPAAPFPYPIVPSFDHWVFPHGDLPAPWRTVSIPEAFDFSSGTVARDTIVHRDATCRVTASYLELEHAHIVPVVATAWFTQNDMSRYTSRRGPFKAIDDHYNGILLRRDVHSLFDKRRFTILPVSSTSSRPRQHDFTLYALDGRRTAEGHEGRTTYHNLGLQPLKSISPELLFARFAWSIFCDELVPLFRSIGQQFDVIVREDGAGDVTVRRGLDLAQVRTLPGLPGPAGLLSRSISPKKRARSKDDDGGVEAAETFWCLGSRDDVASQEEDDLGSRDDVSQEEDDPRRGRKRRRPGSWSGHDDYGADAADADLSSHLRLHAQLTAVPVPTRSL